tara:strand:+ start:60 stop:662 length:603 start_codon:yes stop_codon:yes gene_type:complete
MFTYGQVTVIDDFVDKDYQEKIKIGLLGGFDSKNKHHDSDFPWFYLEDVTAAGDADSQHRSGLGHQYVEFDGQSPGITVSDYHELFIPLLKKVGLKCGIRNVSILQGRSFLQFPIQKKRGEPDLPHIDINDKIHIVGLYYVIDSDGDTVIYNERKESKTYTVKERVTPKQGRIVIFDGGLYHTAEQPLNNTRCIVNYNLE